MDPHENAARFRRDAAANIIDHESDIPGEDPRDFLRPSSEGDVLVAPQIVTD